MATPDQSNMRPASTTWTWKRTKMRPSAGTANQASRKASRFRGLQRRDPRSRINLTVSYKGGTEVWYVVEARGRVAPFTGVTALHDVMREINRDY